jgi:hypothetical protein
MFLALIPAQFKIEHTWSVRVDEGVLSVFYRIRKGRYGFLNDHRSGNFALAFIGLNECLHRKETSNHGKTQNLALWTALRKQTVRLREPVTSPIYATESDRSCVLDSRTCLS